MTTSRTAEIELQSGESFDFESFLVQAERGRATLNVTGYLDGEIVGVETFRIRSKSEELIQLNDQVFDNVDRIEFSASRKMIFDDMVFEI